MKNKLREINWVNFFYCCILGISAAFALFLLVFFMAFGIKELVTGG